MRILTFLHSFEPGGVERVALRLVRRWRYEGIDAPLFMGRTTGAMREEVGADLPCHVPPPPFAVDGFETLWMIATLPRTIRQMRPDVLFCAGNSYAIVAVAMKLILGKRCPPILAKISNDLDRRDMPWPVRKLYRIWLRIQGRFIDHFVGMETPMAAEIEEAVRVGPRRISIIPDPALSVSQIETLRGDRDCRPAGCKGIRFAAVGRLAPQKNFQLMLRAFAQGAAPGDTLAIYGEGPERGKLEALSRDLGLQDQVIFAGHVSDPARRLAAFDVFLLSSDYEGVPAVLLEALACGLPIIATECSRSIRTLMADGKLGRLVPVGDATALATVIGQASTLRQDEAASLEQAKRFTLERSAGAYAAAFAFCLCHENSRGGLRQVKGRAVTAPKQ